MNSKPTQQKELVHHTSPKLETKTSQKEEKIEKWKKKIYHRIKKSNLNIENHRELEVSHKKIIKHSFHDLEF